jgi:hypothetical protein
MYSTTVKLYIVCSYQLRYLQSLEGLQDDKSHDEHRKLTFTALRLRNGH